MMVACSSDCSRASASRVMLADCGVRTQALLLPEGMRSSAGVRAVTTRRDRRHSTVQTGPKASLALVREALCAQCAGSPQPAAACARHSRRDSQAVKPAASDRAQAALPPTQRSNRSHRTPQTATHSPRQAQQRRVGKEPVCGLTARGSPRRNQHGWRVCGVLGTWSKSGLS